MVTRLTARPLQTWEVTKPPTNSTLAAHNWL